MKQSVYRYKATLVAMISLVAMCGCAEKEIDTPTKQVDKLYFKQTMDGQAEEQLNSRAYTGDVEFETRGFTVAGYRTNGVFSASNPNSLPFPNVFDIDNPGVDKSVIKIAIDNNETNADRKYWTTLPRFPLSSVYNISYFAWSSSVDGAITAATSSAADKGYPWIDATVGAATTNQPDIVGALSMNHNNDYTVSAIDLDFKHLLSKMSFRVKSSNGMVANITKAECVYGASAVYSKARFTFDGTADVGSWGDHEAYLTEGAVTATNWNTISVSTTTPALLGSMTLIPQSLTDQALSLNITYTTEQGGATSQPITRNVPLKAIDLQPGKNYVYTLDLNANEITFKVKVEGWIEMLGTDKGLPLVPGDMDPDVLLLLEGTDPPYTTADGSKYWLDRSGWNNHCQIMGKDQYSGANSFEIEHDPVKRGYVFNPQSFNGNTLYNHIRIPYLGTLAGNVCYEVVCNTQGSDYNVPLAISSAEKTAGNDFLEPNTLFMSINDNKKFISYYGSSTITGFEFTQASGYDWKKLSFYGHSRANNSQEFMVINNTNSTSRTSSNDTSNRKLQYGMIGARLYGIINYVKIFKKAVSFDEMMTDYGAAAQKYYIKTAPGTYAPKLDGLLACWDARTGLVQGAADGNGAYWMDQSGNGYFLRATVPQGASPKASITYNSTRRAMVFAGPKYSNVNPPSGVALINPVSMGKTRVLTFELVYQGNGGDLSYSLQFLDKENGNEKINCRAFTGDGYGFETSHYLGSKLSDRIAYHYTQRNSTTATMRQHAVAIIDYNNNSMKLYINGTLHTNTQAPEMNVPVGQEMNLGYTVLGNQMNFKQAFGGDIHAFRIYNRALTESEISSNYQKDKTDFKF